MQFLDFKGLSEFLKGLFGKFSEIGHKHTTSDITDYVVDSSLSSTSTNPIQNKVINAEFDAVSEAMGALEAAIDDKLDTSTASSTYETKEDAQLKYDAITDAKADWNQNDESAVDYVKNRTHWVEQTTILPETIVELNNGQGFIEDTFTVVVGEKYNVTYNGTRYESKAIFLDGISMLGNAALLDIPSAENTNEPFLFGFVDGRVVMIDTSGTTSVTLSIKGNCYHTLSSVYLPVATETSIGGVRFGEGETAAARVVEIFFNATKEEFLHAYEQTKYNGVILKIAGDIVSGFTGSLDLNTGIYCKLLRSEPSLVNARIDENGNFIMERKHAGYETTTNAQTKYDNAVAHSDANLETAKNYTDTAVSSKADVSHNHDNRYYTESEVDELLEDKSDTTHNHDSAYDAAGTAQAKADAALASSKSYTDTKISNLINSAPTTLDTLGEIATAMEENADVVEALEDAIGTKANATHVHAISDVSGLQTALDGKAASSHGTHVSYSSTAPVMDGTASVGTASTVARSDHKHPTDTSRASQSSLDSHTGNTTSHITSTERTNWNAAKTHADSAHAPSNAQANQNAFSNVKVGSTTISADTTTDTLELVGSNVTLTPDATNDKVTIGITKSNVTTALGYTPPTTDTVYTHPTTSGNKHIPSGGSSGQILRWSADGTAVWGADNNTTYNNATTSASGLMSATDKTNLNTIVAEKDLYAKIVESSSEPANADFWLKPY